MKKMGFSFALLPAMLLVIAGCTTTGSGIGVARSGTTTATFVWKSSGARSGIMTAKLSTGVTYAGPFFQITSETTIEELTPLWTGWGDRWRWRGWTYWGPSQSTLTHYSGRVLANLTGADGQMRCHFRLMRPSAGMAGGGQGRCQLPGGTIIDATFPPT
ncbi:hypothetical protein F1640_21265 [Novosphingobium sp. NBM11]|nr:hypothetical protein [Novosphingobium sp. NBM11]